ncbi:LLM class flavin-dependent oxidoreductase [Humitalea rosea]|nr:LLM class flavin-dependent oxidoreductase [Humitalea rosea]
MILGLPIHALGYHQGCWRLPEVPADGTLDFRHAADCARIAERGKFDFLFLADSAAVRNLDDPAVARDREHEQVKNEPLALLCALAMVTERIGLVATASTTYNEPFNLARSLATLDHISGGRAGWNLVTGFSGDEARNYGFDAVPGSDLRHERAREFVDVTNGLFDSWDNGAFPRDRETGIYFDRAKMHFLEHRGKHFKVRGPLDVATPPQRHLPIITAGYSDQANEFTAEIADAVYAAAPNLDVGRAYYAAVKGRLAKYGRAPDSLKVLAGIMPFVGRTRQEAQDKFEQLQSLIQPEVGLGMLRLHNFPDLRGHDLDGPMPEVELSRGRYDMFSDALLEKVRRENLTIRQTYEVVAGGFWHLGKVGTAADIADTMEEWFSTGAADGFNIQAPYLPGSAADFVELVVPELQRRGLFRTEYETPMLRDRLGLPPAVSRYDASRLRQAGE